MALCNICIPHIPVGYAGTQAQGGESISWDFALIKHVSIPSYRPSMALDTGIPAGMTTPECSSACERPSFRQGCRNPGTGR